MDDTVPPKKPKGNAGGQYLGYALQPVRLFFHLMTCPAEAEVGLEHMDDVSVHLSGKVTYAEQCKSALVGNPIANWSPEFWKTFSNWIDNINSGFLDAQSTCFQMYVVPTKNPGFSGKLSALKTDSEIDAVIEEIRNKRTKLASPPECEPFLAKVLGADAGLLRNLIRNFVLANSDNDPVAPILARLDATVRPEMQEPAAHYGIGDAMKLIDEAMRSGDPPLISASMFRKRFKAFIFAHDSARFLYSLSTAPTDDVVAATISRSPCFIRQLDLVECEIGDKTRAASDFLRTAVDRTRWAEEGMVFEGILNEYDSALLSRHRNLSTEVSLGSKELNAKERGRLLYARCCLSTPIPIEGRNVPMHFLSGSLNALAERREIGWHADFASLLDDGEE